VYFAKVLGALVVTGLGITVVALARQLPYHADFGPGPGFLPTWIGYVLAVCGAIVTLQELRAPRTGDAFFRERTVIAVRVLVAIALAFLLIPFLGFSIAFGLFMLATMRILGTHRWWACGGAAVVTVLGVHQVFAGWLGIPLPGGLIGW
jgi:hypothetical protein